MMNSKIKFFIKNISYTLSSNLLSLLISIIVILVVPKIIGTVDYGYWQLYLFYSSYVGLLHFGWSDGIYLKEGGKKYSQLDKKSMFNQFYLLLLSQLCLGVIIVCTSTFLISDPNKKTIFFLISITMLLTNLRSLPLFLLQATNRIKEYAVITLADRLVYFILIALALVYGVDSFKFLIIADVIGKAASLLFTMYYCNDIVFRSLKELKFSYLDAIRNISVGIKLMFAYIASLLIIGIVRFGVERTWGVETFGSISLILSISTLLIVFINAIGVALFPVLKRVDEVNLKDTYLNIKEIVMALLLSLLLIYEPINIFMKMWLPQYEESLKYLALIFPLFIFEGKMILLITTYLKVLRKEKKLLKINMYTLVISIFLTYLSTVVLKDLEGAVMTIMSLSIIKTLIGEIILGRILKLKILQDSFLEILVVLIFIVLGWYGIPKMNIFIFTIIYLLYLFIKRKKIALAVIKIKNVASLK